MLFFQCCCRETESYDDVALIDAVPCLLSEHGSPPTLLTSGHRRAPGCAEVQKARESRQSVGQEVPVLGSIPMMQLSEGHGDKSAGECLVAIEGHPSDFATKPAVKRKCLQVSESTGLQTEAEYCVDVELGQLMVKAIGRLGHQEIVTLPVTSITDIYTIDDGQDCFPVPLMKSLSTEEKAGLFFIEFTVDHGASIEHAGICLVEASRSARDELLQRLFQLSIASTLASVRE
mmetsp:Transcript_68886/g.178898  ORF Transcript_68886/g.178898 Transcript_68886/m.178898 type:complete len:232 (+) Transcript_68886:66-761(+)